jgi:putative nucleotidyltransferase with HDIG domain
MLATEAVMRKLAEHFGEDVEKWGLAGLLHDLDYDETYDKPEIHGLNTAKRLEELGVEEEIIQAIKAHAHKAERESRMGKALYAADPTTGFLVACALMAPGKKLASVNEGFALRRFKEKSFARGANREQMRSSAELGLSLEDFMGLCLEAMQGISEQLGL